MSPGGSITQCLTGIRRGDNGAAQVVWEQYADRLIRLCRQKLKGASRRVADEEDVVLSAMESFYRGARQGRFPRLGDRHDLWQVIVMITARKLANQIKHHRRLKRGGGQVRGESIFIGRDGEAAGLAEVLCERPGDHLAAEMNQQCRDLLDELTEELRAIAVSRLHGYTNAEIAEQRDCTERTVERKLAMIRKHWTSEV